MIPAPRGMEVYAFEDSYVESGITEIDHVTAWVNPENLTLRESKHTERSYAT